MKSLTLAMRVAGAILLTALPAVAAEPWLHVRVVDQGAKHESVRINIPLSMVEGILPAIDSEGLKQGRIKIGDKAVEGVDLHAVWTSLKAAEDGEYVTVDGQDESVRVSKQGDFMLVRVEGGEGEHAERVNMKIPLAVVDALLSAPDGELDLQAALKALKARGDGELVSIEERGGESVKVWIDRTNTSK